MELVDNIRKAKLVKEKEKLDAELAELKKIEEANAREAQQKKNDAKNAIAQWNVRNQMYSVGKPLYVRLAAYIILCSREPWRLNDAATVGQFKLTKFFQSITEKDTEQETCPQFDDEENRIN